MPFGTIRSRNKCLRINSNADLDSSGQIFRNNISISTAHEIINMYYNNHHDMDIRYINYATVLHIYVSKAHKWQVLLRRTMAHRHRRNGKPFY